MASNKVLIKFLADTDGINKGITEVNSKLDGFGKSFKSMATGLLAGFTAAAILDLGKSAVLAASDFNEMASKVDQVFGDKTAATVKAWADDAAVNFGLTKTAALDAASTFGVLGEKAGLTGDELGSFSTDLGALAADMASFSNTSVEDAIAAIGSGLRGEAEPLRRYGVLLDDATLKAQALKLGIYEGNGTLTAQQKILAANATIFEQTSKAQGDFARTSTGLANQTRILQAELGNLSIALGQGLLDGFGNASGVGASLIQTLQAMEPTAKAVGQAFGENLSVLGQLVILYGHADEAVRSFTSSLGLSEGGIVDWLTRLDPFTNGWHALGEIVGTVNDKIEEGDRNQAELTSEFARAAMMADAYAGKLSATSKATRDEAYETKQATDAQKELNAAFADAQAARSWVLALDKVRESNAAFEAAVKKSGVTLDAHTAKGRANRDAIVNAFADNEKAAIAWGEQFGKSTEEVAGKADELNVKTVKALKKAGYRKADIEEFLGANGLWTDGMTKIATQLGWDLKALGKTGKANGTAAGGDIGQGLINGLTGKISAAYKVGGQIAAAMERGARDESDTHSPSRKWAALGVDLAKGLEDGFGGSESKLVAKVKELLKSMAETAHEVTAVSWASVRDEIATEMEGVSLKVAKSAEKVFVVNEAAWTKRFEQFKTAITTQRQIIEDAQAAITDMADQFKDQVLGGLKFSLTNDDGTALTPEQIVQGFFGDARTQAQVVDTIADNIGTKLPPALLEQVLAMPPDTAIALAKYLGENPDMLAQLAASYEALGTYTYTTLGIPMGKAWATVGGESATKLIASAKKQIADEADDFKKWVKSKLATEVVVKVRYEAVNSPGDVMGAVSTYEANNGTTWRT